MFPGKPDVTVNQGRLNKDTRKKKGGGMKNRERQRANRRIKEEMLSFKDMCGVNDPTPYEAVREIIQKFRKGRKEEKKYGV